MQCKGETHDEKSRRFATTLIAMRVSMSSSSILEVGAALTFVLDIVKEYGNGGSLTNVDAKDYAALVADVEALT